MKPACIEIWMSNAIGICVYCKCIFVWSVSLFEVDIYWKCISIGKVSLLELYFYWKSISIWNVSVSEVCMHKKCICIYIEGVSLLEYCLLWRSMWRLLLSHTVYNCKHPYEKNYIVSSSNFLATKILFVLNLPSKVLNSLVNGLNSDMCP